MFKFSGFSPRANAAINSAMSEASLLGHSFIGTEHLIWGILREGDFGDIKSLSECKIDCEKVLGMLLEDIGRGTKSNLSPSDFSPLLCPPKRVFSTISLTNFSQRSDT